MDPIKESLIHTVGNLDEHEANVHAKVLGSVHAKLNKKQKIKWFPIWVPVIVLAGFMAFFAIQMIQPTPVEQRTASQVLTKDDYQFLYELMQNRKSTNPADLKFEFVAEIALPHYAQLMGTPLNERELNSRVEEQLAAFKKSEVYESMQNTKFYETVYIPLIEEANYSEELLLKQLKTEYPSFNDETLEKLLHYNAIHYFMTLNEAEMFASNEELASIVDIANKKAKVTIMQIEKDYMIAIENGNYFELNGLSPEQIASFKNGVYKIPVGLLNSVNVGSTTELVFWQDKYAEHIIEILPISSSNSLISFELDYPTSTSFLALIKDFQWTKWTSIEDASNQLGILFENQHYIIQYNPEFDQFTIYDMLDEEKASVPSQFNSQLIELIKIAKFPANEPPQN